MPSPFSIDLVRGHLAIVRAAASCRFQIVNTAVSALAAAALIVAARRGIAAVLVVLLQPSVVAWDGGSGRHDGSLRGIPASSKPRTVR